MYKKQTVVDRIEVMSDQTVAVHTPEVIASYLAPKEIP